MPQDPKRPAPEDTARLEAEFAAYAASDAEYSAYQEADDGDLGPPPTPEEALRALRAAGIGALEKEGRPACGVTPAQIDTMAWLWRMQADLPERLRLAEALWRSGLHEAMLAAAKMLTQARIRPDTEVWALLRGWAPDFAGTATSDAASAALGRRLIAAPSRVAELAEWVSAPNPWTRRAALSATLPFAKLNHPDPVQHAVRVLVLDWGLRLARDPDHRVAKSVAPWLRTLARHDAGLVRSWAEGHGAALPPGLRAELRRILKD